MTHPDLVERLNELATNDLHSKLSHTAETAREAIVHILTLQSGMAEQEKTISKLREGLADLRIRALKGGIRTMTCPGPCVVCGLRNYSLSMGGLSICPSCDCGNFGPPLIERQRKRIAELESQLAEARNSGLEEAAKAVEKFSQSAKSSAVHSRGLAETYPRRRAYHSEVAAQCETMGERIDEIAAAIRFLKSQDVKK